MLELTRLRAEARCKLLFHFSLLLLLIFLTLFLIFLLVACKNYKQHKHTYDFKNKVLCDEGLL